MSRKVDYFVREDVLGATEALELFEYDARLVPYTIRALEGIKAPSFWVDRDTWIRANNRLALAQERLLQPVTDRIIREIRATRDGSATPLADQDPTLDPFTLALTSLRDIRQGVASSDDTALAALQRIEALQTAANQGDAESLEELLRIGAIIAGLL